MNKKSSLFVIEFSACSKWDKRYTFQEQASIEEHGKYLDSHFLQNKVIVGGPYKDQGEGLAIFNIADVLEAKKILKDAPAVKPEILKGTA